MEPSENEAFMSNFWVLLNYPQTLLEIYMISRIARLSLATIISTAIGITPIAVMAADPVPAPAAAPTAAPAAVPAAAPADKASEKQAKKKAKKEKKAEKKPKKKSKKKAKPAADAATQ